jgi:AcrR family transcriptional regulator
MDEVAERADVARGTVYNLFESRSVLIAEALSPLMVRMAEKAEGVQDGGKLEQLAAILSDAWKEGAAGLRLMLSLKAEDMEAPGCESLQEAHERLIRAFLAAIRSIRRSEHFRLASDQSIAYIIFKSAVPLLEAIQAEKGDPGLEFAKTLRGLLVA